MRPRLLYLVTEDWYFVSHRMKLAEAALKTGYDVTVATNIAKHAEVIRAAGFDLVQIDFDRSGLNPASDAKTFRQILKLYRQIRPNLVHQIALKPVLYGSLAARFAGVPGVVNALMGLGYVFSSDSLRARALRPVVASAIRQATTGNNRCVIVQNPDDAALLVEQKLTAARNLRLILGSGVDLVEFPARPLPNGRPRVVLPARLLRDKGVLEFVEAARILKRQGVDAEFVLAGAPDPINPGSFSQTDVEGWTAEGVVTSLGWSTDMSKVFADATIVCLPSYREGLPKALLEAAATSRPIVATDVPGCREIVLHNQNGILVPARDSHALAEALKTLIRSRDLCEQFGRVGRRLVEDKFSIGHVIRATLQVYDEMLQRA